MELKDLKHPSQLRDLSMDEMTQLAAQIRREIVNTVSVCGGHLASNLGVVELTMAMHRVFDAPKDQFVFDVGHQSYVHKILTGRYDQFSSLRTFGGMAGFPKRSESDCDVFETGHASTALSAALGLARARDYQHKDHHVVAVVGDGALTGGMCYEAFNDAGNSQTRLIVILNDNEMSIAPNVGALSRHLTSLRVSRKWRTTKKVVKRGLISVPVIGKPLYHFFDKVKDTVRSLLVKEDDVGFFAALGFHYYGPVDGHDIVGLEKTLAMAKDCDYPVVIHVLTRKGHGYEQAEAHPEEFHGTPPFFVETGDVRKTKALPSFGKVMGQTLSDMADEDDRIVAITAAMPSGTGLSEFAQRHPQRMIDVGIAEEHAVTMAAGLAAGGMKPYFAVYASFFQRGYDQMIHDVCLQNLPVTFLLDRAGMVGEDGPTHHGVFDLSSLMPIPNMTVLAPRDLAELRLMMRWTQGHDGPVAIRYGRNSVDQHEAYPCGEFTPGKWEVLEEGTDCVLLAVGSMVREALDTRLLLKEVGISAEVVNCSTVKPLDEAWLSAMEGKPVFTMEEHALEGGFGASVCGWCSRMDKPAPAGMFGIGDDFVPHGKRVLLLEHQNLLPEQMAQSIREKMGR
ncbi:MAG: 1-deoxy-D-xylulose-5-phosphate synthase [Clostridiales bacterium]|nr:1-deoxy-D-xylulose-5-phosphate synthase [Clostridiales bacterium]